MYRLTRLIPSNFTFSLVPFLFLCVQEDVLHPILDVYFAIEQAGLKNIGFGVGLVLVRGPHSGLGGALLELFYIIYSVMPLALTVLAILELCS